MKKLDTIVPIIPPMWLLAEAKFYNVLAHPISKRVWADSFDFDIVDRKLTSPSEKRLWLFLL